MGTLMGVWISDRLSCLATSEVILLLYFCSWVIFAVEPWVWLF